EYDRLSDRPTGKRGQDMLLNRIAPRRTQINRAFSQNLLLAKQPGRRKTQPAEDDRRRIEHGLNPSQVIGDPRKNSSNSDPTTKHEAVKPHRRASEFLCSLIPNIGQNRRNQSRTEKEQ